MINLRENSSLFRLMHLKILNQHDINVITMITVMLRAILFLSTCNNLLSAQLMTEGIVSHCLHGSIVRANEHFVSTPGALCYLSLQHIYDVRFEDIIIMYTLIN